MLKNNKHFHHLQTQTLLTNYKEEIHIQHNKGHFQHIIF